METEKSTDILLTNGYDNLELDGLSQIALPYIAPEIINGIPASPASDIWGLGCIFFKMFFGVTPFASQVPAHVSPLLPYFHISFQKINLIQIPLKKLIAQTNDMQSKSRNSLSVQSAA